MRWNSMGLELAIAAGAISAFPDCLAAFNPISSPEDRCGSCARLCQGAPVPSRTIIGISPVVTRFKILKLLLPTCPVGL